MKKLITTTLLMIGSTVMGKDYYSTPSMDSFKDISLITRETFMSTPTARCFAPRSYKANPKWKKDYIPAMTRLHYGLKNFLLLKEEAERIRHEANRIATSTGGKVDMSPEIPASMNSPMPFGGYFRAAVKKGPQNIYMQYWEPCAGEYDFPDFELAGVEPRKTPNPRELEGLKLLERSGKKLFLYSEYFEVPSYLKEHPSVYVLTSPSLKNPWFVPEREWTSADGRKMKAAYIGNREVLPEKILWVYFWKNERLIPVLFNSLSEKSKAEIEGIRKNRSLNTNNSLANN